jgi:succinate dehydrogenase / fumarate reductase flavoprotein subunit
LGGNSLSDLLVFGKRAGEHAAEYAKANGEIGFSESLVADAAKAAEEPFDRPQNGDNPFRVQHDLQDMMQRNVGIVRREAEMQQALPEIEGLRARARTAAISGNREFNPGWHTALDLGNLLTISEAIARAGIERKESRGAHFRDDFPDKDPEAAKFNIVLRKGGDGQMTVERVPIVAQSDEQVQVIQEMG